MDINGQRGQFVHAVVRSLWRGVPIPDIPSQQHADIDLGAEPEHLARDVREVLLVDPALDLRRTVRTVLQSLAVVDVCSTFSEARTRMITRPPDLLVTGVRLDAHNGLHLVYLAPPVTRCIVYAASQDFALAREVQEAGAFFVRAGRLADELKSYVTARLPRCDRRDPAVTDRRKVFRGGRRCTDS
jgi:hypothetical protein